MLADRVLADAEVAEPRRATPRGGTASRFAGATAWRQIERHGATRFTTRTTLRARGGDPRRRRRGSRRERRGRRRGSIVEQVLAASTLGEDQRDAVRGLAHRRRARRAPRRTGGRGEVPRPRRGAARVGGSQAIDPIGLAPSAMAAQVLRDEAGLRSETLAKFLYDYERGHVAAHPRPPQRRGPRRGRHGADRRPREAARSSSRHANAKLVLVGDPHQLGAVGPGGIFRTLVADHGAHELETVRRFHHAWEAAASLRLRDGNPAILAAYDRHDRIASGSRERDDRPRLRGLARRVATKASSLLLMAGDNATADELARRCRAELVARGEVDRDGVPIATGTA